MINRRLVFCALTIFSGLILVCGGAVTNVNVQAQSSSSDFPLSSPSGSMTQVSGRYSNTEAGVQITLPTGWTGIEAHSSNGTVIILNKNDGAFLPLIQFGILHKSDVNDIVEKLKSLADNPAFKQALATQSKGCDIITYPNIITINGMRAIKEVIQCSAPMPLKAESITFETDKDYVSLTLMTDPADFEKYSGDFSNSLVTLSISNPDNTIDVPEFGSLAGLAITMAVIGIVVISRRVAKSNYKIC